jgi:hypothetical protein
VIGEPHAVSEAVRPDRPAGAADDARKAAQRNIPATVTVSIIKDPEAEHGRGLLLVRGLSVRTGVSTDHHGRLIWAYILWARSQS